ncbi:hypothetical protein HELRODRAFT_194205 [Helobdella robusta]|uniref:Bcl-2 Bcl-2 homology region 1-3 domain-containing protein n=1 Tax=Helobdella robusta TaxID=6412 RepID=T1FVS9_HELRO|nr:hypothetical protein HELRODRAFT_194205 [Helobdella robusta]ESN92481.1 hypothetical protein HELRODRAFT_194205 [Helobdella robusta]
MSSISSEEFSYQTRVVVYNFLGLVPAQTSATMKSELSGDGEWQNESLKNLPSVSLIDKLKDSEAHLARVRCVNEEVKQKVRKLDSGSEGRKPEKHVFSDYLFKELLQKSSERRNPASMATIAEDENIYPTVTVIKKRKNYKIFESPSVSLKNHSQKDFDKNNRFYNFKPISPVSSYNYSTTHLKSDKFDGKTFSNNDILDSFDSPSFETDSPLSPKISTTANSRQNSVSMSTSSKLCSTYFDITDLNDEEVISSPDLPSSTLELKKEINKALTELEDEYLSSTSSSRRLSVMSPVLLPQVRGDENIPPPPPPIYGVSGSSLPLNNSSPPSPSPLPSSSSSSIRIPESEVAERLRALGDQVNLEYEADLNAAVQDVIWHLNGAHEEIEFVLRRAVHSLVTKIESGWSRVALLLVLGQRILFDCLRDGVRYTRTIAESIANMLETEAGDFIVNNGGWNTVTELEMGSSSIASQYLTFDREDGEDAADTITTTSKNVDENDVIKMTTNKSEGDDEDVIVVETTTINDNDYVNINNGSVGDVIKQQQNGKTQNGESDREKETKNDVRDIISSFEASSNDNDDDNAKDKKPTRGNHHLDDENFKNINGENKNKGLGAICDDEHAREDERSHDNMTERVKDVVSVRNIIKMFEVGDNKNEHTKYTSTTATTTTSVTLTTITSVTSTSTTPSSSQQNQPSTKTYHPHHLYGSDVDGNDADDDDVEDIKKEKDEEDTKYRLLDNLAFKNAFNVSLVLGSLVILWYIFNKCK